MQAARIRAFRVSLRDSVSRRYASAPRYLHIYVHMHIQTQGLRSETPACYPSGENERGGREADGVGEVERGSGGEGEVFL